ncbi:MAG: hypothetical protein IJV03_03455 [Alphaproteobacteria bacterium]|nr:hypothetical protein [Alphaproteobacteria bacterium]
MFTDKPLVKQCPQISNPEIVCRKTLVYQALHSVELSYEATCQLDNILSNVCGFCIKEHTKNGR